MKKIIYIANLRLPTEKAYGIQIAKTCEAMADLGHSVILLYPFRISKIGDNFFDYYGIKRNFDFKKVSVYDFYWPGFLNKIASIIKNYFSAKALIKEALKENADIYYTRDELVAYLLNKKNKKVVFECHRFSNKRKLFYYYFKRKNLKIVAISDGLKEDLVKLGIKDSNIRVARDGVDLDEFNVTITKEEAKNKIYSNMPQEFFGRKKIAVYVGHFYNWKGVNLNMFSEIARYICEKNPDFIISIFGGTDKDLKTFRNELQELKKTHSNLAPMIYLGGRVFHRDIPYVLKTADCAILTGNESEIISAKYTSPLKMFEYMASGCPIVAQDLPSFREVLNNSNSFLVEPSNAKALADQIALIFDDNNPEMVKEKTARALKASEDVQQYTWRKRASIILSFLG